MLLIAAAALAIRAPLLSAPGFPSDQAQFMRWSARSQEGGLASVYEVRGDGPRRWCNYPPAYLYVLRLLGPLASWAAGEPLNDDLIFGVYAAHDAAEVRVAAAVFKLPAVIADLVTVAVLILVLSPRIGRPQAIVVGAVYAAMPAVVHNSSVWGQVDAIHTLLMVLSLEMLFQRRFYWMTLLAVLSVLTKAQAILLAPLWVVPVLLWARRDWRRWGVLVLICIGVAAPILLPFTSNLAGVWEAYAGAASYYPFLHLNGFSAWFLLNPMSEPHLSGAIAQWYAADNVPIILGLTPRQLGMIGFVIVSTLVMLRLAAKRCNAASLRWAARTLPLAFFVLSTQMHERYLFPAIAIWAWAAAANSRWWIGWVLLGVCVSVNSLWAWPGPQEAWWSESIADWLHRPGIGTTCSAVIVGILALSLANWFESRASKPSRDSASFQNDISS